MPASRIKIRAAKVEDIGRVRQILVETWHDTYDALIGHEKVADITGRWHAAEVLTKQLDAPSTSFLVASYGDELVGHAFAHSQRPPVLILARLYVLPRCQRQGIGSRLLDAVTSRHPGSMFLRLSVEAENAKGVSFYRAKGFEVRGERIEDGLKALLMEKALT